MNRFTQPTKEDVRDWILRRREFRGPLPEIRDIQREVGWIKPRPGRKQTDFEGRQ